MKIINIIVGLILIFLLGSIYFLAIASSNGRNTIMNSRVKNLYRDYDNHGQGTILMNDGKKIPIRDDFYYDIKIGDSLIKEKNSLKIKIIRQDSVFYIHLK